MACLTIMEVNHMYISYSPSEGAAVIQGWPLTRVVSDHRNMGSMGIKQVARILGGGGGKNSHERHGEAGWKTNGATNHFVLYASHTGLWD